MQPCIDVRLEVKLRILGDPIACLERGDELARAGHELTRVRDTVPALVVIPPPGHAHKLHRRCFRQAPGQEPPLCVGCSELERLQVRRSRLGYAAKPAQQIRARGV